MFLNRQMIILTLILCLAYIQVTSGKLNPPDRSDLIIEDKSVGHKVCCDKFFLHYS